MVKKLDQSPPTNKKTNRFPKIRFIKH